MSFLMFNAQMGKFWTQWPFLNYFVYLVKNYYAFEGYYTIKTNIDKKLS